MNPLSQKGLLKYALNNKDSKKIVDDDSDSDNEQDLSGFGKKLTAEEKAAKKLKFE